MERFNDQTKESLLKLWSELQEDPFHEDSHFAGEIWKRIQDFEKEETEDKLDELRQEIKTYLPE